MRDLNTILKNIKTFYYDESFLAVCDERKLSFPLGVVYEAIERAINAEAEVERLRAEVNSYNTTLGETISECAANMQKKEQENERLRLYVKSITGGFDEAIETVHYLEAENAKLHKVADAARTLVPSEMYQYTRHLFDLKHTLDEYDEAKEDE